MKTVHQDGRTTLEIEEDDRKLIDEIADLTAPENIKSQHSESNHRLKLLQDAIDACCTDRHLNYGDPEDSFACIAEAWDWWMAYRYPDIDWSFHRDDVPALMILMKMARLAHAPSHRDSKVDIAGYAACWADLHAKQTV